MTTAATSTAPPPAQQQKAPTKPAPTPPPKRMTLDKVVKGKLIRPRRVFLYGPEGIGKSTFGAGAPKSIFLEPEAGTTELDVERFPTPPDMGWLDLLEAVHTLTVEDHEYRTLVLDTADKAEALLWSHMCKRDSTPDNKLLHIEDYGYGKGYSKAVDEWRVFIAALERLRTAKGMHIIILAHSWVRTFKNPAGDDFDRYEPKLHPKAAGVLKEWVDAVLFANHDTVAVKDSKTKRVRGVSSGARYAFTDYTAAYDAKNRYGLTDAVELSWQAFDAAAAAGRSVDAETMRAEITRKAAEIGGDLEKQILEFLAKAGTNPQSLALINNRVNAQLAKLATEAEKGI